MTNNNFQLNVKRHQEVSANEHTQITALQAKIFGGVPQEEIQEDFYANPFAVILAKLDSEIVGYCGLFERVIEYKERSIHLGGLGGLMTVPKYRNQGIGGEIVERALQELQDKGCDVAFLSVDTNGTMENFYHRYGFLSMKQEFSWRRKSGSIEADHGGMIAHVCSNEIRDTILHSDEAFFVGDGYW